ncbi:unnamed protein product [Adineta steineri]|uniref:Uncharacterized protein n=1 Tax=Adineta steineri TaxID=433720 RepID=A0A813PLD9_9BILA|nr:unnamed protein product [Adineta steineri]CAF3769811.1 unnamed protein product [Adineta steineri]
MTDINNYNSRSPLSISSSSSSSSSSNKRIKIKIKLKSLKTSTTNRRSQRRRTNPQPPMRTSSLITTIFHENGHTEESLSSDTTNDQQIEKYSLSTSSNNLLFTTTSKTTSKASYWTVTDRQSEWYKLSMPVNLSSLNTIHENVPYKKLSKIFERKIVKSNNNEQIDQPTDTTQLIMKAVMHELDYDIDDDDIEFLHDLNQYNKTKQKRQINEEEFENAIIILEFSIAEKIRSQLKQKSCEDDDVVCDICLLPDADDENEMVFCERCNCCVHQNCYGISDVPSGTWLCRPCSILRRPTCILCPKLGGPMKCTTSGTIWCHLTCALWLPELKFVDYTKMEPVIYLDKISHARWSLRCVVCSTMEGACVQCAHKNCRTPFHVTCGLAAGYFLDVQQTSSKESSTSRSQFNAYCFKHSEEARKRSEQEPCIILSNEDDSSCSSSVPSIIPLTVYRRDQLKTERWIHDYYKNFASFISPLHLHEECPQDYDENISKKIYNYWIHKRQSNKTLPLIKRIDFVLEQRENAELLITQINTCLKVRQKLLQLQTRCKSILDSSSTTATLTQRLDSLKKTFSSSFPTHRRPRRLHSSSTSLTLHGKNDHENENQLKTLKRHRQKLFYSTKQYQTIEKAKRCRVSLESTYRDNLQLNTTYLIRTINDGQMILLPKKLLEQANIIPIIDNDILQQQQTNILHSTDYSDLSDDEDKEPLREKGIFKSTKTAYTSHGNVVTSLTNTQTVSTETKFTRIKPNIYDPILSANSYVGHLSENERTVQIEPRLYATDADPSNSINGKICGYELSLHKHDDILDEITQNIPFTVEILNNQPVIKLKSNIQTLDCEIKQTHRLFIRAFDCASTDKRRYSERSSLIVTVDDVNEYAPVFTHDNYLFKLHQGETCESTSCRVEATDDDCANTDHRVCGYEITTPNVPFSIDSQGSISITKTLTNNQYVFNVIAIDCFPSSDNTRKVSEPAQVTFKIIKACKPSVNDNTKSELIIQSDRLHLFDGVNVNTCDETCIVEDIVGTVELHSKGLDSGCNLEQCSTTNREYILLEKDGNSNEIPQSKIMTFNGYNQALIVNQSQFSGHLNNEFTIHTWMKHTNDGNNNHNNEKEHVFCKSDEKLKNRHHAALFIQNNYLKLLLRKGPLSSNGQTKYPSEWMWKIPEINDNQWHSYKFIVNYPTKVDLYVDERLVVPTSENFRVIEDSPLTVIPGTEETIFALGGCWHARASRLVQHFRGQVSGLTIEQKEDLQRSSSCIRDCHQYIDISDVKSEAGVEFASNSNRSMWILRTDARESYEKLLKHIVYRNTFQPLGPNGQRTVSINTRIKCLGEVNTYDLPALTRYISIVPPKIPVKIELKADTSYLVPELAMEQGIYLFRNLSVYTNAIKKSRGDISDCTLRATPPLSNSEQLIIPDDIKLESQITKEGAVITGVESIDSYQYFLRQIAYISKSPVTYVDRSFLLSCAGAYDRVLTNEIRVRIHIEKQMAARAPVAAVLSNKFVVNNDGIKDNLFDVEGESSVTRRNVSDWPIAVVICVSIGLVGVLVLYLVVRMRSTNRQNNPLTNTTDDIHSQMEWEDDIGLNIIVNPYDEAKNTIESVDIHNVEQPTNGHPGASSDDEGDEFENNRNGNLSGDDDDFKIDSKNPRTLDHQYEWDDAAIEYGPKKV